ncbi:alkaline phosphatase PafA [Chryseosolibacter indicus]|uniref:Alkaline phosphatase family protein n=1 Tax=Chryseosolibacter indicus TaxID=2782351 RepID=A0ABS5VUB6_9BACT|nr:alkaline phosphatase PafA [Chryseosolibacter indicus]MBT1705027.1 alkaline phosphatase family protein [Chryseosolibacter indicus]
MNKILFLLLAVTALQVQSQVPESKKPKLVIGIVVDQMRQEYLYRFSNKFGNNGFKRLMRDGFYLKNAHYNYAPTVTGPGHASVFTGSTPAIHGIISNDWYDKNQKKEVNCVNDPNQKAVGNPEGRGGVSPARLLSSTITDELKLFTQKKAKVIGISLKDRGAVLPAGHMANGAYWYDSKTGKFISSTYYMTSLPAWVEKFNQLNLPDKYLSQELNTLLPINQYVESGPDDTPYENKIGGKERPTYPYNLKELRKKNGDYDLLAMTPFADDYLTEMAKAAIAGEELGADEWTDFLTLSYSSTDIIGHAMGPNSVEVQDVYLRLDKNIEDLLNTLDQKVGKDNYILFLTADHAVADVAQYLKDNRVPAGYFNQANVKATLNEYLQRYFPGRDIIEAIDGEQVFFNQEAFQRDPKSSGIELMVATELVMNFLMAQDGVANVYSESLIRQSAYDEGGIKGMVVRGYHPKRSGDLIIVLEPGWYSSSRIQGTTHGSPYRYDTNVPVMFYGAGIKKGFSVKYHPITDIAPTVSVLLNIKFPNGSTGQPIEELFEE